MMRRIAGLSAVFLLLTAGLVAGCSSSDSDAAATPAAKTDAELCKDVYNALLACYEAATAPNAKTAAAETKNNQEQDLKKCDDAAKRKDMMGDVSTMQCMLDAVNKEDCSKITDETSFGAALKKVQDCKD